jgi:hypothetical protein
MRPPRSQHGYTDIDEEMETIDSLGPLARALFNDAPRELSAKSIVEQYVNGKRINLRNPKSDAKFARWLASTYRVAAGHDINDGVRRRIKKAAVVEGHGGRQSIPAQRA